MEVELSNKKLNSYRKIKKNFIHENKILFLDCISKQNIEQNKQNRKLLFVQLDKARN